MYFIRNLSNIFQFETKEIEEILNDNTFKTFIDKFKMTPKKWIRLRKTVEENANSELSETTTLTIKHILKSNTSGIQQMKETEILINSLEETNELLENLVFSYRSYQEKKKSEIYVKSS